ncbi:MAG: 6,7-dimethyl-8-ribityllumazine synthase [Myxococcota bacterium]
MSELRTRLDGTGLRVAVVVARFNHLITRRLLDACQSRLESLGCERVDVAWVPGAFEIPLAARAAADSGRYDAIVALGCVIRGGTPHFEYVCRGVTDGVLRVSVQTQVPVAFGVLTTDTAEQALARASTAEEPGANKGAEAAEVAVDMARVLARIQKGDR